MWLGSLLAVSLLAAAPTSTVAPGVDASTREPPIATIVFDAAAIDAELAAELALRTSGRELVASDAITELPTARFVWLSVTAIDDEHARLELISADGRAYAREVTAPREQLRRALAGAAANMIAAIERGEILPDRSGVAVPQPRAEPATPAPSAQRVDPPVPAPVVASRTTPPPVRWELGTHASAGIAIGLGPPLDLDGLIGAGGALGLDARHRSGALVGLSARVLTHARAGLRLVRVRIAVTGGYALRRGRFELISRLGLAVEPIVLRDHGARGQSRRPDGAHASTVPLVGVLAGLSPGVLLRPRPGGAPLRLSLELELAAAMEARARPGIARYLDDRGDEAVAVLRAGGVELGIGVGLGGWFALR